MGKEKINPEEIFNEAAEINNPEERRAYLDKVCGDNKKLRAEVEALLQADEKAGDFLEVPAFGEKVTLDNSDKFEGPGTMIGHYKLLELIGEGGMGLIYLAEQQEPIRRKVALKIVKLGMDTKQVIARFEAEKQALAVLDHPNIAQVYDAGTTETGRPYFVMEYVKGISITKYCDEHKLNIEQRLRLFEDVCEGVHHAHQKGIIHRDLKPSNILITVHGDKAVPKIIDFGIAKAITQPLTDKTFVTFQGQLLGTPQYMSPEQVDMATQDIDTRSDIYSLGVVLYELLAGALPFDMESFEREGFAQFQQTLRELEPASPSMRLTALGEKAKTIAASRGTQVVTLARRLHRELEWIPLKAMRKDRCRRYRSASEMADDVRNYLNGLPLIAGPETAVYRVKKFVHKHAGSVATVLLVAAAIILGLVISIAMYFRAEAMRVQAEQAKVVAEQAKNAEQEQRKVAEQKAEDLRCSLYINSIQLADAKHHEGNARQVRGLLDSCPEDLRGWEWNRLNYISDQSVMTLRGQSGFFAVTFSPDSKYIVAGGWDRTITVWDATSGKELRTLHGHEGVVHSLAISSDSRHIVSGSEDKTIRIWDLATGEEVKTIRGHKGSIDSVALSPDGKLIASNDFGENVVRVWNVETGTELMTLGGSGGHIRQITFSPDGKRIVSSHDSGEMKFWDAVTGKELMTVFAERGFPSLMAFSKDSKKVASVGVTWDPVIKIWDSGSGRLVITIHGQHVRATSIAFSPDGKYIANANMDNTIKVWDAETGEELKTFRGHDGFALSASFSPDSKRLVSCSWDGTVKLWDLTIERERFNLHRQSDEAFLREESDFPPGYSHTIMSLAFSPDGRRIASASFDKMIRLWDVKTGTEVMTLPRQGNDVVFSPDGKRIAAGGWDRKLRIWDVETGTEVMTLSGHMGPVESVVFSQDGKLIASGCREDKTIKVWNAVSGEELISLTKPGLSVLSIAFSPDGKHIVSGSYEGALDLWDLSSDAEPMILRRDGGKYGVPICSVAFSPDGKRIISGDYHRTVSIWDTANGSEIVTLRGHGDFVTSLTFMPDGKRIISGCRDGTVKLWDSATGTELLSISAQKGVYSVALSPDGRTIATGIDDGSISLWESAPPADGYEPRKIGSAVTKLVDELHQKLGFYHDVLNHLQNDITLDSAVRNLAIQIANSRKWEDAEKLNAESWEAVSSSGSDPNIYRDALEKAEKATRLEPNNVSILGTLGISQYRVGAYEDCLETLNRTDKIRTDANEPRPEDVAFIAMAQYQLGLTDEAEVSLDRLRDLLRDKQFAEDEQARAFLSEAEKLIESKK